MSKTLLRDERAFVNRETIPIAYAYEATITQATIRVQRRKPARSRLRRVLRVLAVLAALALALVIAAGIVGEISNHPAGASRIPVTKTMA